MIPPEHTVFNSVLCSSPHFCPAWPSRLPPSPNASSPCGPWSRPNVDMFWVISSDGISWEELACAKEKSTVLKAPCFQFAATCFKLATYLLRLGNGHRAWGGACIWHRGGERERERGMHQHAVSGWSYTKECENFPWILTRKSTAIFSRMSILLVM